MKIAFDFGGVISDYSELRELAVGLLDAGHDVYLIGVAWPHEPRKEAIDSLNIAFTESIIIDETGNLNHGLEKARIMKNLGCNIIVDDNIQVIEYVNSVGLLGLQVR